MYRVRNAKLITGKRRVSNAMLHNVRNPEEAGERYRRTIMPLIERLKLVKMETAQEADLRATRVITDPWTEMVKRKQSTTCSYWNAKIKIMWNEMQKARIKARSSGLETDKEADREKRKRFQKENRLARRRFERQN